jgi:hypothetical protein
MSSPTINKLARQTQECQDGRLPCKVIEARMKALRAAGRYEWRGNRQRYVVTGW